MSPQKGLLWKNVAASFGVTTSFWEAPFQQVFHIAAVALEIVATIQRLDVKR